ncbi:MAG: glycosyltransferase family 4 protein [Chloroflexi bacterium]|nr:glycosyltransferase family 4 protein [Chloroflexota bacterium]
MADSFEKDLYPGKTKILFIGLADNSHTHSWINLLESAEFNIRLFGLPVNVPPKDWQFRTYVTIPSSQKDSSSRKNLYKGLFGMVRHLVYKALAYEASSESIRKLQQRILRLLSTFEKFGITDRTPSSWLAQIIRQWKPDIIHTLGVYDHQGGLFYYQTRKDYRLEHIGKWVLQLRGGSDLELRRHDPRYVEQIRQILSEADQIISDNLANVDYAAEFGIPANKFAPIIPVPGTGGLDLAMAETRDLLPPSKRERIILYPKAYESQWSKALPALEALKLAWDKIQPCEIYLLAMTPDVKEWFYTLPESIQRHCHVYDRIERSQVFELLKRSRVMLSPSLVDGVPNTMYEAMLYGAMPIISPLNTIISIVSEPENVLFARNLYPAEIGTALIKSMLDDELVDRAWKNNQLILKKYADRSAIKKKVIDYYHSLVTQ